MTEYMESPQFDELMRQSYGVPAIRGEFVSHLREQLLQQSAQTPRLAPAVRRFRPAWAIALVFVALLVTVLVIGPQKVYAAVIRLLGYIPGVGVVEETGGIRVLAEPVTVEQGGISVTVTSTVLTGENTHIAFRFFGIPPEAYPASESDPGCVTQPYLRLSDGTELEMLNDFPPIPADMDEAVLVFPCLYGTLPGSAPENWELNLRFAPAPPDFEILPVVESLPTHTPTVRPGTPTPAPQALALTRVLDTGDRFVLMGEFNYRVEANLPADAGWAIQQISITDAQGKEVPQLFSNDFEQPAPSQPGVESFLFQLPKTFVPPLTITYRGQIVTPQEPAEQVVLEFDAGENPRDGGLWDVNQELTLGGYSLRLTTIESGERGYIFHFQGDPAASLQSIQVEIAGYAPVCGGGGGAPLPVAEFTRSVCYADVPGGPGYPHGKLQVIVHFQPLLREEKRFTMQWAPETGGLVYATATPQAGVCALDALASLDQAPAASLEAKALIYEKFPSSGLWGLALYSVSGGLVEREELAAPGNWGGLSADGSQLAYSDTNGNIHILDLTTREDAVIPNANGYYIRWLPDNLRLAYFSSGVLGIGPYVINTDGSQAQQISNLGNTAIAGGSPDGNLIYYAVGYAGGGAWNVYAYDLAAGSEQELFTIENGTPKFLNIRLSPDGEWLAYRGTDNSSLYLVRTDGSGNRLLLDNAGVVGVEWTPSGWLGLSLSKPGSDESAFILLDPASCQVYRLLPDAEGTLEGLGMGS